MTETIDLKGLRDEFPALAEPMRGHELIYFDNSATSLKPLPVIDAVSRYYREYSANIHRGVYEMSGRATMAYDTARESVKRLIGCTDGTGEVIFTRGTTESMNMVATGWGSRHIREGDEIVVSPMDHHSNIVPWQQLAQRTGAILRHIPLTPHGSITEEAVDATISSRTRIVSITAMSNVTGYMPPVERIIEKAHAVGARVLLDGAQFVSHYPTDVNKLDCDFLAFSGHKMCGPTGIGALYGRMDALEEMDPFLYGGDMISRVTLTEATWAHIPERFEGGTPNIAGAIGMGAAADYLMSVGLDAIADHEKIMFKRMYDALQAMDGVTIYGETPAEEDRGDSRGGIVSFNLDGVHPNDVGTLLDQQGIAVRTGFHCAQPLMDHFGITGTVRASFYLYNTEEEIDRTITALKRVQSMLS
jgi:cysteine desulfurase / selenocysteine lyase